MKITKRTLLIALVPLLSTMTASADSGRQLERTNTAHDKNENATSWRASNVIGLDVKNANSETIGDVEDIVLDMKDGKVIAVIISSGGFLGIGESFSAVPLSVLRYDEQAEGFKTSLTKEQLDKAPQFKADEWPDYNDESTSETMRSYSHSINSDTDTSTYTANSGNEPGRDAQTANKHGTNAKDEQIAKDIRSEIMDTQLSSNAKNINIIARDERVTLNGEVDSDTEREAILKIAEIHCKKGKITDEMTVRSR